MSLSADRCGGGRGQEVEGAESSGGVGRVVCCGPEGFMREAARLLALEGHRSDRIVLLDA